MRTLWRRLLIGLVAAGVAMGMVAGVPASAASPAAVVVVGDDAGDLERLAAAEVQRYLYQLTGDRPEIVSDAEVGEYPDAALVVLGQEDTNELIGGMVDDGLLPGEEEAPGAEGYVVRTVAHAGRLAIAVMGSDDNGTLYGAYELLEQYGARFYIGRDVLPDTQEPFTVKQLDITEQPAHERRGVLPWHNFLNGPSSYSFEDFKSYLDQLGKMKMNTLVLHNYADGNGGRPMNEPFLKFEYQGVGHDGWLDTSVSAEHYLPRWGMDPFETGEMAFGSGDYFPYDVMGSDAARYTVEQPDSQRYVFSKAQSMMQKVINYAQSRGMEVVLGTDFDIVPREIAAAGGDPLDPEILAARIDNIVDTYPTLRYVQFHFHEHTGDSPTDEAIEALRFAHDYLKERQPDARLVTGGWFQEQRFPELDEALPEDIIFSSLMPHNMDVREEWGQLQEDREIWPIPWMEHDANLSEPQFGVSRMAEQLPQLRELDAEGVFGILWRERPAETNVAYLAQDAWQPSGEVLDSEDFYRDYATANFGEAVAEDAKDAFLDIEATGFPKTSGMTIEYGQWSLWGCCTEVQVATWERIKEQFEALSPQVTGPNSQANLDHYISFMTWLEQFWIAQQAPAPADPHYERTATFHDCDSIDGWTASGGHELVADPDEKQEGTASCSSTGPGPDYFRKALDEPIDTEVKFEDGVLAFWLYVSDPSKLGGSGQVELTSSGGSDQEEMSWGAGAVVPYLSPGWNLVRLPFRAAGRTGGSPYLSEINFFRLYLFPDESVTLKVDDLRIERQVVPDDPVQRWEDLKDSGFQDAIKAYQDMVADRPLQGGLASAAGGRWYGPAYQPLEREILDALPVPPPEQLVAKGTPDGATLSWQAPELPPPPPQFGDYTIDAGGDGDGDLVADFGYSRDSSAATFQTPVTNDFGYPDAMRTERWSSTTLTYRLPAPPELTDEGRYRVELFFVEGFFDDDAGGQRVFDIEIDGEVVEEDFDPTVEAGGVDRGVRREYEVQVEGDELVIRFIPVVSNPKVNIINATRIDADGNPLPPVEPPDPEESGIARYHVYRSAASGGEFERLTTEPLEDTAYEDTADGEFVYAVTAVNDAGVQSPLSYEEPAQAGSADSSPPRLLLIPRNLHAVRGEPLRVTAIAPDGRIPDEVSATLHYRALGKGSWQSVEMERNSLARPYTLFADVPASEVGNETLEYYVEASDGTNTTYAPAGAPSVTASALVEPARSAVPGTVRGLGASWDADAGGVMLSWNPTSPQAHQYNIYRSEDPGFTPDRSSYVTYVPKDQHFFLDVNVDFDTTYYYKIEPETVHQRSGVAAAVTGTVPPEQHLTVQGTVTNDDEVPLSAAQVILRDDRRETIAQARTDAGGRYTLQATSTEPTGYELVAVRRGHLPDRDQVELADEDTVEHVDLELEVVQEPIAGESDAPTDFAHTRVWTQSVQDGVSYHFAMNNRAQATITARTGANNNAGAFQPGWLTDFALTDDVALETLDWTEYVLTTAAPGPPDWNRSGEWLPLPDIRVEDDTISAAGVAQIDDSLEATMTYRSLGDAPVIKLTLAITNTGGDDFDGAFHYNIDPDAEAEIAIVPGIAGTNPGFVDGGWSANYVYNGPTEARDDHPAHAIAWLEDEPVTLSAHGYIFGAWFDATVPAGETTTISWYHITDYPAAGDDVTANIQHWASQLGHLDEEVGP